MSQSEEETGSNVSNDDSTCLDVKSSMNSNLKFQTSLATFAFSPTPRKALVSRPSILGTSEKRSTEKSGIAIDPHATDSGVGDPTSSMTNMPGPSSKKRKRVRGYAEPETYAHLQGLSDFLIEGLDVVFCGINPGEKSAEIGHHYGHPTNHFWDCLYQSGFTTTKIPPEEDHTLPARFSIGLTNLVERPTAEQNELSPKEQAESVPTLLDKVMKYRPRILCFLGLGIAQTFQRQLTFSKGKIKNSSAGLRSYKIAYDNGSASDTPETLFYALPSPSARVVKPQKAGKIAMFSQLKETLICAKQGKLATDGLAVIILPSSSGPLVSTL